jgi:hypothetical protein
VDGASVPARNVRARLAAKKRAKTFMVVSFLVVVVTITMSMRLAGAD